MSNFISDCLQGLALLDDIDDYVELWHENKPGESLYEYLGMTRQEYNLWVLDDSVLAYIVQARHKDVPVDRCLSDRNNNDLAMAARSEDSEKARELVDWLKKIGKWQ